MQNAGHRNQHRNSLTPNQLHHSRRLELLAEVDLRRQEGRYPEAHELPEDVTERQTVQKPQWVHPSFVLQVLRNLVLDGLQARKYIAVGEDNSLRLRCRAGCKDNLKRGLFVDRITHRE